MAETKSETEVKEHKHLTQHQAEYQSNPFLVSVNGLLALLKVNPVPSLLLCILLGLIVWVAMLVSFPFLLIPIVGIFFVFGVLLCILPFVNGAYHALAVSSIKGENRKTEDLIGQTFKKLPSLLGASVLIFLIVFGGLLLFVVPGIIFGAWFSMTFFVMFDENLGAIESMKRSKALVKGHVLEIISSVIAGSLLSGTSMGGGGGLLSPAIAIAPLTGWYPQLKELKTSGRAKPPMHWMNIVIIVIGGLLIVGTVLFFILMAAIGMLSETNTNNSNYNRSNRYDSHQQKQDDWLEEDQQYYLDDNPDLNTY